MYRRLGYYPTETSEHSSEYVPWYLHDDAEIERLRIPVGDYLGSAPTTSPRSRRSMPQVAAGQYVEPEEEAAEYAPQVIHSMVTGTPRTIQVNVAEPRPRSPNLPAGAGVEVPCVRRRRRRPTRSPSAPCRRSAPPSTGTSCRSST